MRTNYFIKLRGDNGKMPSAAWNNPNNQFSPEEINFPNVGFVPPTGYCIVDADDKEAVFLVEKILKSLNIPTDFSWPTTHGKHFFFKFNPKFNPVKRPTSLPRSANSWQANWDYKGEGKGQVRITNRIRPEEIIRMMSAPDMPELPLCLYPIKAFLNFNNFNKGERDATIFRDWIPQLRKHLVDDAQIIQELIEQVVVGYHQDNEFGREAIKVKVDSSYRMGTIEPDPLKVDKNTPIVEADGEVAIHVYFKTDKQGRVSGIGEHREVYKHYIKKFNLAYDGGRIWQFDTTLGIYVPVEDLNYLVGFYLLNKMDVAPSIVETIAKGIQLYIAPAATLNDPYCIQFSNGIFNTKTGEFAFNSHMFSQNIIPWEYHPLSETNQSALEFIKARLREWATNKETKEHSEEIITQLLELTGLAMTKLTMYDAAYFLYGRGSNGKSAFLKILSTILGKHNVSNEDLKTLTDSIFSSANIYNRLANINGDISASTITDPSLFKKLTSGDRISGQFKHKAAFEFNPYATLIFGCNNIPRYTNEGASKGVDRRIILVPFENEFTPGTDEFKNYYLMESQLKSKEVIEALISLSVEAIYQVNQRGELTKSAAGKIKFDQYRTESDHIFEFYQTDNKINEMMNMEEKFARYKIWSHQFGYLAVGYQRFLQAYRKAIYNDDFELEQFKAPNGLGTLWFVKVPLDTNDEQNKPT